MSNCEEIAQVAHDKLATVRKSLSCEQFAQVAHDKRANEQITCFFLANPCSITHKNKQFTKKIE